MSKISIIGAGSVGATIAYALLLRRLGSTISLIDVDQPKCHAQVLDLRDSTFFSESCIIEGTFKDAGQSDIIILTAGAKQKEGETRTDLVERNYTILKQILKQLHPIQKNAILIIVSNPVDILTYFAHQLSELPPSQIIGSGTLLDTMRLRADIANILNVSDSSISAYVLGEHGDSQFIPWSSAHLATVNLLTMDPFNHESKRKEILSRVSSKAYEMIKLKGATYFGIGACVSRIVEGILLDQQSVWPLSVLWDGQFNEFHFSGIQSSSNISRDNKKSICISLPVVLGRHGISRRLQVNLNNEEKENLEKSVDSLRKIISNIENDLSKQQK